MPIKNLDKKIELARMLQGLADHIMGHDGGDYQFIYGVFKDNKPQHMLGSASSQEECLACLEALVEKVKTSKPEFVHDISKSEMN